MHKMSNRYVNEMERLEAALEDKISALKAEVVVYQNMTRSLDSEHNSRANISDCQQVDKSTNAHDVLRQKDQGLFLALQDVRRLRSELEWLSKSEKWYKLGLYKQKHAEVEWMEKLYGNEPKYMEENQELLRECSRLYARCGDVEHELEQQHAKQTLVADQKEQDAQLRQGTTTSHERNFEHEQQLIADQQQLIELLCNQKFALLENFKRLNEKKDAHIFELDHFIRKFREVNFKDDIKLITLLDEQSFLEETIKQHGNELLRQQEEQQRLELSAQASQLTITEQQRELVLKEKEIHELPRTHEITALKSEQQSLQQQLEALTELQAQNEQQQRELEHLKAALADKNCELHNMREYYDEKYFYYYYIYRKNPNRADYDFQGATIWQWIREEL